MSWKNCVAVAGGANASVRRFPLAEKSVAESVASVPSRVCSIFAAVSSPVSSGSSATSYTCMTPATISNAWLDRGGSFSRGRTSASPVRQGAPLLGSRSVSLSNTYSSRSAMQCSSIKHTSSHSDVSSSSGAITRPYS